MTNQTPKAFDFDEEPELPPEPGAKAATPKAFDFGDAEEAAPAPQAAVPPRALSFDDVLDAPGAPSGPPKAAPKPLFASEDHPAVRDALQTAREDYPLLFEHSEQRLAALFRRILPVKLSLVMEWAETPLMEQGAVLQPVIELVRKFSDMAVPALLEAALESAKPPSGVLAKLFSRPPSLGECKTRLTAARTQLQQLLIDSEGATANLDESAKNLTLHWVVLAVVTELAGRAPDALE